MKILREFNYVDANGKPYQKIRVDVPEGQKEGRFKRRQPAGNGGWKWNWDGLQLVPYNLNLLLNCNDFVMITAGERDADSLSRAGFIATTNPESESCPWKPEYNAYFGNGIKGVYIFADQDETGEKHAKDVAQALYGLVPFVRVVNVPRGKDVSEFLEGMRPKDAAAAIMKLCDEAPEWHPTENKQSDIPNLSDALDEKEKLLDDDSFIEYAPAYLSTEFKPRNFIIREIVPEGVLITFAGHPRAMKTLGADEIIVAAATGTPAFGLDRFTPTRKHKVWRLAQEDPHTDEQSRMKAILASRGITEFPANLAFTVHKGIDLDDPIIRERILRAIKKHGFELIVIDPIRNFSSVVDKGPADVRVLTGYFRLLIVETGCTIIVIHHFVKEPASKSDERRRAHRTSGGGWFAAVECPIFFEKITDDQTLVVPEDFKFSHDPVGFTFRYQVNGTGFSLIGQTEGEKEGKTIAVDSKIVTFLTENPKTATRKIRERLHLNNEICSARLDAMYCKKIIDFESGTRKAKLWFVNQQ